MTTVPYTDPLAGLRLMTWLAVLTPIAGGCLLLIVNSPDALNVAMYAVTALAMPVVKLIRIFLSGFCYAGSAGCLLFGGILLSQLLYDFRKLDTFMRVCYVVIVSCFCFACYVCVLLANYCLL